MQGDDMPEVEESQELSNIHTDTLNDLLNLQDRQAVQMLSLAEGIMKRDRHIRAHLAAHGQEIDYTTVLAGRRGGA
jgi:hypothetical protein